MGRRGHERYDGHNNMCIIFLSIYVWSRLHLGIDTKKRFRLQLCLGQRRTGRGGRCSIPNTEGLVYQYKMSNRIGRT